MSQQVQQQFEQLHRMMSQGFIQVSEHLMRLRKRVSLLEAKESLREAGRTARYPLEFRSQFGEDCLLWDLFAGQMNGFYIEVGAFDGYDMAVTYAFDCLGWNGLLIEGIPERAAACKARRTGARVVNAALGKRGSTGTTQFTVVDDHWGGMLSYHTTNVEHTGAIRENQQQTRKVTVPMTSMDELLKDHTGEVDVAVIDVEGGELEVLDGFNLSKWKPKVLMLEDNLRKMDSPLGRYMQTQPYTLVTWLEVNRVYVRSDLAATWAARLKR